MELNFSDNLTIFKLYLSYNAIKDPQWYAVKGSDTTMLPMAASSFGHSFRNLLFLYL